MTPYQNIRHHLPNLTQEEQLDLLAEITMLLKQQITPKRQHNIMELEGLGKTIWQGIDAQTYVEQERAAWNG